MNRSRALWIAGLITVAVLVTLAMLNVKSLAAFAGPTESATNEEETPVAEPTLSEAEAYVVSLQAHRDELAAAVTAMETRETEYQKQLEAAKQTISELEATIDELESQTETGNATLADYESQLVTANNIAWELRATAEAWQAREAEYAAQIEDANRTILALQAEIQQLAGQ